VLCEGCSSAYRLYEILFSQRCTMWVASPWRFSEMTIQPARHGCNACCLLRAEILAFHPVAENTRGTPVEQVVSSFQKILRGSQLTWYSGSQKSWYAYLQEASPPQVECPTAPTPSDCALFVLFCAIVINICACMVTFLFYIFFGPANFTPTYPHKDI